MNRVDTRDDEDLSRLSSGDVFDRAINQNESWTIARFGGGENDGSISRVGVPFNQPGRLNSKLLFDGGK